MKTIHTTLPVYDSLDKQDYRRTRNKLPVHCPRWRLPAMQWNVEDDDPGELCSMRLVDIDGTETELLLYWFMNSIWHINTGWAAVTNAGYDVFNSPNGYSFNATKTTAIDVDYAFSDVFSVVDRETYLLYTNLDLITGVAPQAYIVDSTGAIISNVVRIGTGISYPGAPTIFTYVMNITATDANARIRFRHLTTELSNYVLTFFIHKTTAPALYNDLTNSYFQYKGGISGGSYTAASRKFLPYGNYYLKMTTVNNYVYYSEIFAITDIYPNLISSWVNMSYDTFTSIGVEITSAIDAVSGFARSYPVAGFYLKKGENIKVIFFLTLNSGTTPTVRLYNIGASVEVDTNATTAGLNDITLTTTRDGYHYVRFTVAAAANFSTSEVLVMREYSETHIKLTFDNTKDLGDILYQDGFSQTLWLPSQLAPPQSEQIDIGEEKNGIFIAEKLVNKFKFKILVTMGRELYRAVVRIPLHDDIDIIDEVGNTYSPAVGNIWVNALSWPGFDYVQVEILFNDNNEIYYVSNNANFT